MKANEAPEKLYIALNELTEDERTFVLDHRVDYPICTEYTRTNAVIEKVCEGIEHLLSGYIIRNFHFGDSYKIDTLIEDIKNYMKEK
jgi:hypothetical protein